MHSVSLILGQDAGGYYNFTNIRYAAPPLGNLRFAPPQPPAVNRSAIETGNMPRLCPQGFPGWGNTAFPFMSLYTAGLPFNVTSNNPANQPLPPIDPRTTEDCLFLDVMVPKNVFKPAIEGSGAPVLGQWSLFLNSISRINPRLLFIC